MVVVAAPPASARRRDTYDGRHHAKRNCNDRHQGSFHANTSLGIGAAGVTVRENQPRQGTAVPQEICTG
jgi:hypothetical protein